MAVIRTEQVKSERFVFVFNHHSCSSSGLFSALTIVYSIHSRPQSSESSGGLLTFCSYTGSYSTIISTGDTITPQRMHPRHAVSRAYVPIILRGSTRYKLATLSKAVTRLAICSTRTHERPSEEERRCILSQTYLVLVATNVGVSRPSHVR